MTSRRRVVITAVALAGFVGAFLLLALSDDAGEPGGALLFAPFVALLAFEYGFVVGGVAGVVATALYLGAFGIGGGDPDLLRAFGRGIPMAFLGVAIGLLGERLRESELRYRRIVDNAGEVIWVVDATGIMTFVNRRVRDVLGYEPEELIGKPPTIQQEPPEATMERIERRRRGETDSYDLELRRKDGESVWVHVIGTPIFDRNGHFVGGLGMASDITARRHAEEELAARERALEDAQAIAHIGSWEWDIAANRVTWSNELFRIYGVDRETFEASYEAYIAQVHPEDRQGANEAVQQAYANGRSFSFEHRIVRPNGEVRILEARGNVFRDGGARPVRMAGTGHDITERKQAELALADARAQIARHDNARKQAQELNDTVVQTLVLAKYALDRGDEAAAQRGVESALAQAQRIIEELLGDAEVQPGQLRRESAAGVGD